MARPRAPDQLGDPRQRQPGHRSSSAAPTTPSCSTRCRRSTSSPSSRAQGREELRAVAQRRLNYGSNVDFSRDARFTETLARGATSFSQAYFRDGRPFISLTMALAFRPQRRRHRGRDRSSFPLRLSRRRPGRPQRACAYVVDPQGLVLATLHQGPRDRQGSLRADAGRGRAAPAAHAQTAGIDWNGHAVLTASSAGAEIRLACAVRAADRAGADADPRPAGAHRAADRRSA